MNQKREELPVACSLSTAELRQREIELLAKFRSAVMDTEELPDGFVFRLPGDGGCIALVAELMVAERECCPFLTFEITALPNRGPVMVRVTGPGGAKQFLETILCDREPPV